MQKFLFNQDFVYTIPKRFISLFHMPFFLKCCRCSLVFQNDTLSNLPAIIMFKIFDVYIPMYRPCFVFRHPTGLVRNVFLQPFNKNVWYCVIVAGFVVIGTTSFISYREAKSSGKIRFVNLYTSCDQSSSVFFKFFHANLFFLFSFIFSVFFVHFFRMYYFIFLSNLFDFFLSHNEYIHVSHYV